MHIHICIYIYIYMYTRWSVYRSSKHHQSAYEKLHELRVFASNFGERRFVHSDPESDGGSPDSSRPKSQFLILCEIHRRLKVGLRRL